MKNRAVTIHYIVNKINIVFSLLIFLSLFFAVHGEDGVEVSAVDDENDSGYRTLDGAFIDALETYPNFRNSEFDFGINYFPFNSYYNGFGLGGGYTHHFNKTWGWEVVNATYVFSIEKNLTANLAENFGVNPEKIEKLEYMFSSNLKYVHSFGKIVFLEKYIKSYTSSVLFGAGGIVTTVKSYLAFNFGILMDFRISDRYSWKFEFRDYIPIGASNLSFLNYATFKLVTGIHF